ncbi:hypothetical protein PSPO01_06731 [Paraphaeosphaeria sporulosa]
MYKPQAGADQVSRAQPDTERESLIISKDLVEIEELEPLGHIYKEIEAGSVWTEDIDHIVARSFLAHEDKYRKRFRNMQLRASQTKVDITERVSDMGNSVIEISFDASPNTATFENPSAADVPDCGISSPFTPPTSTQSNSASPTAQNPSPVPTQRIPYARPRTAYAAPLRPQSLHAVHAHLGTAASPNS